MKKLLIVGAVVISAMAFGNGDIEEKLSENKIYAVEQMEEKLSENKIYAGEQVEEKQIIEKELTSDEHHRNRLIKKKHNKMRESDGMKGKMHDKMAGSFSTKDMELIKEKRIEIREILDSENPDMKKAEELNTEIFRLKTLHRENMEKENLEK